MSKQKGSKTVIFNTKTLFNYNKEYRRQTRKSNDFLQRRIQIRQ